MENTMTKYTETVNVGPTTTPTLLVQSGAAATFSWGMAMPEGDPLFQSGVVESSDHEDSTSRSRAQR